MRIYILKHSRVYMIEGTKVVSNFICIDCHFSSSAHTAQVVNWKKTERTNSIETNE